MLYQIIIESILVLKLNKLLHHYNIELDDKLL